MINRSARAAVLGVLVATGLEPAPPEPADPGLGDIWVDGSGSPRIWDGRRWASESDFGFRPRDDGYEGWESMHNGSRSNIQRRIR